MWCDLRARKSIARENGGEGFRARADAVCPCVAEHTPRAVPYIHAVCRGGICRTAYAQYPFQYTAVDDEGKAEEQGGGGKEYARKERMALEKNEYHCGKC